MGMIEELESLYPARCIGPKESPEDAHRYAGKVELIAELRARLNVADSKPELESVLT
jgi:hypothetical protein